MRFTTFLDAINEDAATDIQVAQFAEAIHGIVYKYMKANGKDHNWGFVSREQPLDPDYILVQHLGKIVNQMNAKDELLNAPTWFRGSMIGQLYIILAKESKGRNMPTHSDADPDEYQVKGGTGKGKNGEPVLMLYMLLDEKPREYVDDRFNSGMKTTFVHEFVHIMDTTRSTDTDPSFSSDSTEVDYWSHPKEFQAYYEEALHNLLDTLKPRVPKWNEWVQKKFFGGDFNQFMTEFMGFFPDEYKLAPKFDQKLKRRIYKLYTELLDRQQQVQ